VHSGVSEPATTAVATVRRAAGAGNAEKNEAVPENTDLAQSDVAANAPTKRDHAQRRHATRRANDGEKRERSCAGEHGRDREQHRRPARTCSTTARRENVMRMRFDPSLGFESVPHG
jgi:hypothetical protein